MEGGIFPSRSDASQGAKGCLSKKNDRPPAATPERPDPSIMRPSPPLFRPRGYPVRLHPLRRWAARPGIMAPKQAQTAPRIKRTYSQLALKCRLEQAPKTIRELKYVNQTLFKRIKKLKTVFAVLQHLSRWRSPGR